jgi:sulfur carrier protein
MRVFINGEPRDVEPSLTIAALLSQMDIRTRAVAVEMNLEVIPRGQHAECVLHEGDRLEIVTLVGGG